MKKFFVTLTYAQSLDGRIAARSGESQWISGPETLELAQELRGSHDAVAVGIGTVLRDDPLLTCRLPGCRGPLRVVFDSRLRLPPGSRIAATSRDSATLIFCRAGLDDEGFSGRREDLLRAGIEVVELSGGDGTGLPLEEGLRELERRGLGSLLVEGGAALLTAFLRARLADRVIAVTAPLIIGQGVEAVGDLGVTRLAEALRPARAECRMMGRDSVWELDL